MTPTGTEMPLYVWHYDFYLSGKAPDAFSLFDPQRIADEIASTGANLAAVFALNQHGYAYYPSTVAPVHPSLGSRDYTGGMIDALHERGVGVLTYVNYMNIERREEHPEWWQRAADGAQVYEQGWGVPCPNSPIKGYMSAVVTEVAERYPTDGFFFDMYGFNREGCYCDYCRAEWSREHDLPFPAREDWGSEIWRQYVEFRYQSALKTMRDIRDTAKAVRPGLIWVTHCGPASNWVRATGRLSPLLDDHLQSEVGTYLGRGRWNAGQRAKMMQPYSAGKQTVVILADLHRDVSGTKPRGWFYIPWSATMLKRGVAEIIAHGSWPDIYTEPYPDTRNNPYTVQGIREAFSMAKQVEPYLVGSESAKSVALHYSRPSLDFYGRSDAASYMHSFDGAYKALLESHVPFDIVMDEQILDGTVRQYDLLVLSNSACTSAALNQALRDYAGAGGTILATYKTSLYDEVGRLRTDFGLADLFGAHYRREYDRAYFEVSGPLAAGLTTSPIIAHRLAKAEVAGAEAIGRIVAPSPTDLSPFTYVSAPTVPTEWPALLRQGSTMYCAADLGLAFMRSGYPDHRRLFANCVEALVGERLPLRVQAPGPVDVALRRQGERALVHLVNLVTNQVVEDRESEVDAYEAIPVHDIELRLRGDHTRAYLAADGNTLPLRREGDWAVVTLPRLELYEVVVFE
ncbi:MAG: family 10 glycosylhydrolase [Anaerolineae bacterium]